MGDFESRRPWGSYEVLADELDHKVKRIVVHPGKRLSLQRHKRRSEHWFIVKGEGLVTINGEDRKLVPGDSVDIAMESVHRMANKTDSDVIFIEVQRGDYFGEDDIERFEDDYGRL